MKGVTEDGTLRAAGLDPTAIVDIELEPGDLVIWSLLTVHGSNINRSDRDRAFALSSYVQAANSERGEWAFRGGESIALGGEPQLCKYEQLHTKPGPFTAMISGMPIRMKLPACSSPSRSSACRCWGWHLAPRPPAPAPRPASRRR